MSPAPTPAWSGQKNPFERLEGRLGQAEVLLWGVIFTLGFLMILSTLGILAMAELIPPIWPGGWDTYDGIDGIGSALYALAFLGSVLAFLRWHRQAIRTAGHLSAEILHRGPMKYGTTWATWSWIIPIVTFFVPYRSFKELADMSRPLDGGGERREKSLRLLLSTWWGFWILNVIFGRLSRKLWSDTASNQHDWITMTGMDVFNYGVQILAAFLAILVLRVLTRRHRRLWTEIHSDARGTPAADEADNDVERTDSAPGIAAEAAMPYNLSPGPT